MCRWCRYSDTNGTSMQQGLIPGTPRPFPSAPQAPKSTALGATGKQSLLTPGCGRAGVKMGTTQAPWPVRGRAGWRHSRSQQSMKGAGSGYSWQIRFRLFLADGVTGEHFYGQYRARAQGADRRSRRATVVLATTAAKSIHSGKFPDSLAAFVMVLADGEVGVRSMGVLAGRHCSGSFGDHTERPTTQAATEPVSAVRADRRALRSTNLRTGLGQPVKSTALR